VLFLGLAIVAVLVTAGVAAAANGGFTPQFPHSPNARRITDAYWLISVFTVGIFIIVETALVVFIVKYRARSRPRTVEGAQLHGATRLELVWTAIPIVIICIIFGYIFYKLPGISGPPVANAADRIEIRLDAHQFYWQFTYPNGAISIDTVHLPVGQVARLSLHSEDVNHSWWIPQLGGKTDAIPGRTNTIWYQPDREGLFFGQCAELCGIFHERMLGRALVTSDEEYRQFTESEARATLGRGEWEGVCAKCHGLKGQGDYGPPIASNPTLIQKNALESVVKNGRGQMPAVGNNWTQEQFDALLRYTRQHIYNGSGGSTSGG